MKSPTCEPLPDWVTLGTLGKDHLKRSGAVVTTLCGLERGGWRPRAAPPPTSRRCRRCMAVVRRQILEGRYGQP